MINHIGSSGCDSEMVTDAWALHSSIRASMLDRIAGLLDANRGMGECATQMLLVSKIGELEVDELAELALETLIVSKVPQKAEVLEIDELADLVTALILVSKVGMMDADELT